MFLPHTQTLTSECNKTIRPLIQILLYLLGEGVALTLNLCPTCDHAESTFSTPMPRSTGVKFQGLQSVFADLFVFAFLSPV